jgi:hypothetical protein
MSEFMTTPTQKEIPVRLITSHKVNGLNECIIIEVLDAPGSGGACHHYRMSGLKGPLDNHPIPTTDIRFQNGPIQEAGYNGLSNEALLAILIDRMEGFQSGKYATTENQIALDHMRAAQNILLFRTKQRMARGVEGTHAV